MYNDLILCCQVDVAVWLISRHVGIRSDSFCRTVHCMSGRPDIWVLTTGHLGSGRFVHGPLKCVGHPDVCMDFWPFEDHLDTTVLLKNRFMFKYDNDTHFYFLKKIFKLGYKGKLWLMWFYSLKRNLIWYPGAFTAILHRMWDLSDKDQDIGLEC